MDDLNPRLKKIIFDKLNDDLSNKNLMSHTSDIWILDKENQEWFFQFENDGRLWYNGKFFGNFFHLFYLKKFNPILKEWFESLEIGYVTQTLRKNTNYDYIIKDIIKESKKKSWRIDNRYGFPYHVVKKYVALEKRKKNVLVEDFMPYVSGHTI